MLKTLRDRGLKAVIFEAGNDTGGTWRWNVRIPCRYVLFLRIMLQCPAPESISYALHSCWVPRNVPNDNDGNDAMSLSTCIEVFHTWLSSRLTSVAVLSWSSR